MESLRVSISCFPETMLLTSSLSIETIRTYSKKLKHQGDLDRSLRSNDNQSLYSVASSHNPKRAKRWNLAWLSHNRRSKRQKEQPQYHTLPRGRLPLDMSILGPVPQIPMTPSWGPIKNIFPTASDYLCDALYAHLLAYNYITSLSPTPRPPMLAPPRTSHHHRGASRRASVDTATLNIPLKAASLLGMDDPVAAYQHQLHQFQQQQQRPKTRHLLTRRSTNQPFILNGPYLPFLASHNPYSSEGGVPETSQAMREIQTGLGRCIKLLVATLKRTVGMTPVFGADREPSLLIQEVVDGEGKQQEGREGVDGVLVRALCEVVRCAEEGVVGGG
jgi:hypothetical protein